jgi:signal transduction histidine kinase/HPt (histidine-containing phosphotransfer) domain-containing protein
VTSPIRVLLLEDDPADARLVEQLLRRVKRPSFEVKVVARLAQAVAALAAGDDGFDVVLADLGVPDSAGIATLDGLTRAAPRLPVVVLTGNDDDAVALEAVKRGAQDYLVKGASDGVMLARVVRYAIERKLTEQALTEARDTAEEAARTKSIFLAMMGHEIRTPLNGVLGMARLLLDSPLDHRQRAYAETLVSSGELLLGLVNDVLDFARLDADGLALTREPFDLHHAVDEVRLVLAARAAEKNLSVTASVGDGVPRFVVGDRLRVQQILFNLVGNAIKFTDQGHVSMRVEKAEEGLIRLSVTDTGIGIAADALPKLFVEFWQGDSGTARRFEGAGLGLAICKRLVSLMDGTIHCDSTPGEGSTFVVHVPLEPVLGAYCPPADEALVPARTYRVLLVDDNEINREVAAGLLERRGHQVVVAADGPKAVEIARSGGFDLVLLDMRMPGMDGVETAAALTALPGAAGRVPMVLLTANPLREDESRWRQVGIRACLAKPFRVDDFNRVMAGLDQAAGTDGGAVENDLVSLPDLRGDMNDLGIERMAGLVELFRRSSKVDLDAVQTLQRDGRTAELAQVVHRMASAASSLHLGRLAALCRSMEDTARSDGPGIQAMAGELVRLWERSLAALDQAMDG